MQDILNAGLSPEEIDRRFEASGERMTTPCYDGDMVWRVWGEGPPLVLLHGGYGSWRHWIKNIGPLSQRRRVFVADNPGLGDSASVPLPHSGEKLAAVIVEGIDQIIPVPERFDLVGFSFGGLLGGHVASMMGDRAISWSSHRAGSASHERPNDHRSPKFAHTCRNRNSSMRTGTIFPSSCSTTRKRSTIWRFTCSRKR